MHPDLKLAIELQVVEKEIARVSAEIAYLPRHIKEIESKLAGALRQLDADRQALAENQKERRKFDGDISLIQQKISKYKGQIFEVKTNEQYKALQHEIEYAEGEIKKIEDRILERMVVAEELEGRVKEAEKRLAVEKAEVEKEKTETTARTRADEEQLAELKARREDLRSRMSPQVLREFDRVFKGRKGIAVSEVRDSTCTECNVRLRPQIFQEVKNNPEIKQCENCYRMLCYIPPPPEQAAGPQAAAEPQAAGETQNAATPPA
jgi:uncharacterized protein